MFEIFFSDDEPTKKFPQLLYEEVFSGYVINFMFSLGTFTVHLTSVEVNYANNCLTFDWNRSC